MFTSTATSIAPTQADYTRNETDLNAHVEDDLTVNAIRNGKLVPMHWNDLTEAERNAARRVMFYPCW